MMRIGYPGSTEMAAAAAASPSAAEFGGLSGSVSLLMTASGGILVLVVFFAFGIWLCGRCSARNAGETHHQAGMKPVGLSREAIARIPVVETPASKESCCAICLGEFDGGGDEKARVLPECSHSFHVDCIDMWLFSHKTCPTCRSDLSSLEERTSSTGTGTTATMTTTHRPVVVVVVVDSAG